ncbi:MAG: GNAT family N-acetyltransferase [Hyphomicrobiales bacterium]
MSASVRPAHHEERLDVATFLHERMNSKISVERWGELIDGRWAAEDAGYAILALDDDGAIQGVLAAIYADREINGHAARTCNLSSWYITKEFRGGGLGFKMMSTALSEPGVTFTTYSSNPPALSVCFKAGMVPLETHRLIWHARSTSAPGSVEISTDVKTVETDLDAPSLKALSDHQDLNIHPVVFRDDRKTGLAVFSIKEKGADIAYHEALYISERETFAKHARALADALLPKTQALMSVDKRLMDGLSVSPDEAEPLPVQRGFQSAGLKASEMDFLYSEIPLLDLKLY